MTLQVYNNSKIMHTITETSHHLPTNLKQILGTYKLPSDNEKRLFEAMKEGKAIGRKGI